MSFDEVDQPEISLEKVASHTEESCGDEFIL
jgi:hypothetical protein